MLSRVTTNKGFGKIKSSKYLTQRSLTKKEVYQIDQETLIELDDRRVPGLLAGIESLKRSPTLLLVEVPLSLFRLL